MRRQRDLHSKSEEGGNLGEVTTGPWKWGPQGKGQGLPSHPEIFPSYLPALVPPSSPFSLCTCRPEQC